MTPLQIRTLTDISVSSPVINNGNNHAAMQALTEDGLIRLNEEDRVVTTEKGDAHIRQLCRLPLPQEAWVDHNGKLL